MTWRMPSETAPHERTWMAFPREGFTLGESAAEREEGYAAWTETALAIAEFEPVTMVVDPSELSRARNMLGSAIEIVEAPVDEFWMRDVGPTFVTDEDRPGELGAVTWRFNGWGDHDWAEWEQSAKLGETIASLTGAERISSLLVNEGGAIHVDGAGTVLLTETVQLDPRRNRYADKASVEAEMARTLGAHHTIWMPRGLTRDYEEFGTSGHVDIIATIPNPGTILLHAQTNPDHPDFAVSAQLRSFIETQTDANGSPWKIVNIEAPATLRDAEGFVDWSYVNHLVVNDGVIACGFGEPESDEKARKVLEEVYEGRRVVTVDARPIYDRGGGVHCITQQQPRV